jgi:hypothetical protein
MQILLAFLYTGISTWVWFCFDGKETLSLVFAGVPKICNLQLPLNYSIKKTVDILVGFALKITLNSGLVVLDLGLV